MSQRRMQPELIDQPDVSHGQLRHALRGIARINRWSGSAGLLWPALAALAREQEPRPLRVLDVATGSGDVPLWLWRRARRAGLKLEVSGCDISPTAIALAQEQAHRHGAAARFFCCDAVADPLPTDADAVICSLFLHHLNEAQAMRVLAKMAEAARRLLLVSDLQRNGRGFVLAWVGVRLLTCSYMVHVDGPRSVEGAFTLEEAASLAAHAGLHGATVARRWPCRWLLTHRTLGARPGGGG